MRAFAAVFMLLISAWVYADNAMRINVAKNQNKFHITLPSNPTTGYQWAVKAYDKSLFTLVASDYNAPKTRLIGAGGEMVFTFELIKGVSRPKSSSILLIYARPWQPGVGTLKTVQITM